MAASVGIVAAVMAGTWLAGREGREVPIEWWLVAAASPVAILYELTGGDATHRPASYRGDED